MNTSRPLLSICIATFRRGRFIGETLAAVLTQAEACGEPVEVLVLDGASPDETPEVVGALLPGHPALRYERMASNGGFDQDYDRVVGLARGDWCWLMSDDDLLEPGTVAAILAVLRGKAPDLLVLNAAVYDRDMRQRLKPRLMDIEADREFASGTDPGFLAAAGSCLSFIGSVVIRREAWLARERAPYYGSMFVHVGVILQAPPLGAVVLLARPLIRIRYGNAMWTARGFEIWNALWPGLVWSLGDYPAAARAAVVPAEPATRWLNLLWYRALGVLDAAQLARFGGARHARALWAARFPGRLANLLLALACWLRRGPDDRMKLYDLALARTATPATRWFSRQLGGL